MDQTVATICDCNKWEGAFSYNYNGGHGKPGGISGYCHHTCSYGNAAAGGANDCCKCCCEKRSKYIGSCDIVPAAASTAVPTPRTTPDTPARTTPAPDSRERTTPAPDSRERTTPAPDSRERTTPVPDSRERTTPVPDSRERTTPVPETPARTTHVPTTCTPTNDDCSTKSVFTGGFGFPFYIYFAGSGPFSNGGAAAYCPKGTRGYADCQDACKDDTHYHACVRCCKACCASGNAVRN
ncbi:unnamed protein product [Didymodactylos carnosus]|uniref:Uncharacterized protein n=1 Tax=Didymodactylos carnosus TaxID=1234261 RepID=A0A8S2T9S8_9BILA|nr:unnamed protein product [Didymodactylos carnosus]CAF4267876.1 unnamed protein product [Didymodactylos carnosus]